MTDSIQFLYFDLGNVLLKFDNHLLRSQLAAVAEVPVQLVDDFLAEKDHQNALERGEITFDELFERFAEKIGCRPDKQAVRFAINDIFEINAEIVPIVANLSAANYRLGIISNTSRTHWDFVTDGRYGILPDYFDLFVLSFEIGAMKPDRRVYEAAADLAGLSPEAVFFTDDRLENVQGAVEAGFDAVQFENAEQLAIELSRRGVRFNY